VSAAFPATRRAIAGWDFALGLVWLSQGAGPSSFIASMVWVFVVFESLSEQCSKYGIDSHVVSVGEFGLCQVIFFSSLVVGFGFEPAARAYVSASSAVLSILLKLLSS
jgi:hypothetical protein